MPVPGVLETVGNGTEPTTDTSSNSLDKDDGEIDNTDVEVGAVSDSGGDEEASATEQPLGSPDVDESSLEDGLIAAELGADGRLLQENGQAITTDLEIVFITDVEVR